MQSSSNSCLAGEACAALVWQRVISSQPEVFAVDAGIEAAADHLCSELLSAHRRQHGAARYSCLWYGARFAEHQFQNEKPWLRTKPHVGTGRNVNSDNVSVMQDCRGQGLEHHARRRRPVR